MPGTYDQARDFPVGRGVRGEQYESRPVLEADFRARDQVQAASLRRHVGTHAAGERAFIGQRKRGVAKRVGLPDEFLGMGCTAQETEVADAMQFRVRGRGAMLFGHLLDTVYLYSIVSHARAVDQVRHAST